MSRQRRQRKSAKPRLTAGKASLPHATRRPGSPSGVCLAARWSGWRGEGGGQDAACEAAKPNGISGFFLLLLLFPPPLISPRPRHLGALAARGPHPFKPASLRGDCGEVA